MIPSRVETATHGHVYVALVDTGKVKIGISNDPTRRKRQLETATGSRIVDWTTVLTYAPAACERHLLQRWEWCRVNGEWFEGGRWLFEQVSEYLRPRGVRSPHFIATRTKEPSAQT